VADLTPSERRGALMLLALCALGAAWDLLHARPVVAPPAEDLAAGIAARAPAARPGVTEPAGAALAAGPALDLNRATAAELDALPGIGPVLASRIVEHRRLAGPFRAADELLAVRGIGPHLFARLRPLVTAGRGPALGDPDTVHFATPPPR
jgi:competence protein ComEA